MEKRPRFTLFMCDNIMEVIENYPERLITMKNISDELKKKYGKEEVMFEPRRIGHYVRTLGFNPVKLRNGYTIVKSTN